MSDHFFLSYSAVDAAEFALTLTDKLAAGPPPYRVWLDRRELQLGLPWDEQLAEALRICRGLLFVLTRHSAGPDSVPTDASKPGWSESASLSGRPPHRPGSESSTLAHVGTTSCVLTGPRTVPASRGHSTLILPLKP